jgi:hypothetical protein
MMGLVATAARKGERVGPLSILNPPITDILNDPRVTSAALLKLIDDQQKIVSQNVKEYADNIKPGDITPFDLMFFAVVQHHLHTTTLIAKLMARSADLSYQTVQLNLGLERLTKWLIVLTIVLGIFALPLAIEVVLKWMK